MAIDIARAWKDPEYRKTLTPEELASLPPNPAGNTELTSQDLASVAGGMKAEGTGVDDTCTWRTGSDCCA
jgi:mersacidin/lichenicidin family type 2 lantibiotic